MTDELRRITVPSQRRVVKEQFDLRYRCQLCGDTGAVLARHREITGQAWTFKCACPRGGYDKRRFPRWLDADPAEFELIPEPHGGAR